MRQPPSDAVECAEQPLLPCPFCGEESKIGSALTEPNLTYWVECADCDARSPERNYKESAINWWNHRPSIDSVISKAVAAEREKVIEEVCALIEECPDTFPYIHAQGAVRALLNQKEGERR